MPLSHAVNLIYVVVRISGLYQQPCCFANVTRNVTFLRL